MEAILKRVYWETTSGCNLRCIHCRRLDVPDQPSPQDLTTDQAKDLINELSSFGKPVLILSGGEPLLRRDILGIASYAKHAGLAVGMATNGTLVNENIAREIRDSGIHYASVSLDGAISRTHDIFRGAGSFEKALRGFSHLREAGIKVQINLTVTRGNVREVSETYDLAARLGACALYLFLLVPVGCGEEIADSEMLSSDEVERWLEWVDEKDKSGVLPVKAICAPHFYRVERQRKGVLVHPDSQDSRKGCLAGIHMCFVSNRGEVFPCGYLPVSCGNVTRKPLREIWRDSETLQKLRNPDLLEGACGVCSFKTICGGCRARAYGVSKNLLAEEPYCAYQPVS